MVFVLSSLVFKRRHCSIHSWVNTSITYSHLLRLAGSLQGACRSQTKVSDYLPDTHTGNNLRTKETKPHNPVVMGSSTRRGRLQWACRWASETWKRQIIRNLRCRASRCLCTSHEEGGKFHTKEVWETVCNEAKYFKGNILHIGQAEK